MTISQTIANSEDVLTVERLSKAFGDNQVLKGLNLTLKKGENLVVLGKSGSGKSVLIKCIIGLLKQDEGVITAFGKDMGKLDEEGKYKMRAKIGFLFQNNALYDSMTVRENLEFPLRRHGRDKNPAEIQAILEEALENVGLLETIDLMPEELSGGMRKRIALARTLILKPSIILYDEPTTGLDPITSREIIHLILKIQDIYKTSSIVISHDLACVEQVANRVIMLIDGYCYAEGDYQTLSTHPDPRVREFFVK
jgi:phospholipid/cholesterol/gamma-HCH transport system ATP-binding protein